MRLLKPRGARRSQRQFAQGFGQNGSFDESLMPNIAL